MGMDLSPRNNIPSLHFNWSGWAAFGTLLDSLGCNTNDMRGSNDGELIPADTCRTWAAALIRAINGTPTLVNHWIPDRDYHSGFRQLTVTVDMVDNPTDIAPADTRPDGNTPLTTHIDDDTIDWILDIAEFFAGCGGCRQY